MAALHQDALLQSVVTRYVACGVFKIRGKIIIAKQARPWKLQQSTVRKATDQRYTKIGRV